MDKIIEELGQHKNMVIAGDINIHWDNLDSNETLLLWDTIEATGLKQHVSEFTHNANHITDLLIMESIGLIKVMQCKGRIHIRLLTSLHGCQHKQTKKQNQQNQNITNCFNKSGGILKAFQHQQNT